MDIYEFFRNCEASGIEGSEALEEWEKYLEQKRITFLEGYYEDPVVREGLMQQDIIDMYRRER